MTNPIGVSRSVFRVPLAANPSNHGTTFSFNSKVPAQRCMDTLTGAHSLPPAPVHFSEVIELKLIAVAVHQSQPTWLRDHDRVDVVEKVKPGT